MKLFKYLSSQRIDLLTNCRIRYTQPGAFNDPFEVKPHIENITDDNSAEQKVDEILSEVVRKTYERFPKETRASIPFDVILGIATQYRESRRGQFGSILSQFTPMLRQLMNEKFNELLGILSLTEKPDNLLMWSHYAESHTGFVIGFDSAHKYFDERKSPKDEFRHLRKVEYREARTSAPLTAMDGIDVFLVKSRDWEYEQEWRIMRPLEDAVETIDRELFPICLFEFPPDAMTDVILGSRMLDAHRIVIKQILRDIQEFSHVKIFNAVPDEREFVLKLTKDSAWPASH